MTTMNISRPRRRVPHGRRHQLLERQVLGGEDLRSLVAFAYAHGREVARQVHLRPCASPDTLKSFVDDVRSARAGTRDSTSSEYARRRRNSNVIRSGSRSGSRSQPALDAAGRRPAGSRRRGAAYSTHFSQPVREASRRRRDPRRTPGPAPAYSTPRAGNIAEPHQHAPHERRSRRSHTIWPKQTLPCVRVGLHRRLAATPANVGPLAAN